MNARRFPMIVLVILSAICLAVVGGRLPAAAQQSSEKTRTDVPLEELSAEQVGEQANALISSINALADQSKHFTPAMKDASPEDQKVLELQAWGLHKRMVEDIHRLGDDLVVLEKESPQPALREQVEAIYSRASPRFQLHIDRLRKEIDRHRAGRTKAAAGDMYSIEIQVAKYTGQLDAVFSKYHTHIQQMDQIGMDAKEVRKDLVRLLEDRTDELSGRINLALSRTAHLKDRLNAIPDDADAAKLLAAANKSLSINTTSMAAMLDLMDAMELDTQLHREALTTITQDLSKGLTDSGVALSLIGQTVKKATGWLVDNGPQYLIRILLMLAILLVFSLLARFVRTGLKKAITSSNLNLSQLASRMIINTAANLVLLIGVMLALSQLGISLGPLLAGLGVAGFIVGFALQDTLGNFASGMMILLYRPYDVGDLVDVGGVTGQVNKMSLVSTSLLTVDNQLIVIPNNKIWGDVIKNVTAQSIRRVDMVFGIAYSDDIPKAEKILEDILQSHEMVLDDPEPVVRVHTLGASSVDFVVRPWVRVDDYWDVYWDITRTVKLRFDEEGVSIPFPQQDVHVYYETPPVALKE
jgi:small conductance mechanosensitive channel